MLLWNIDTLCVSVCVCVTQTLTSVSSPVVMRWQIASILSAVLSVNVVTGLLATGINVKVNGHSIV